MRKRFLLPLLVLLMTTLSTHAYDFKFGKLYYNITSDTTVEVTYQEEWSSTNYQGLTTATIPETVTYNGTTYSVTSIGEEAFHYCSSLTSITIPNSVTSIGKRAIASCKSLTSLTIPNSVTSIGDNTFESCRSLASITIPNSVTSIGDNAFYDCYRLTSVILPNSVTSIGEYAFARCFSLTSITIPNSVTSIGYQAFSGCSALTSIVVESGNAVYDSRENCNAIIETDTNTLIAGCQSTTIPNSVTSIGSGAFQNCSSLTSITIPNSVTSIGDSAFYYCHKLTSITIPNSVTSIGEYAFSRCSSLTSITIPNSVTSIGYRAFEYCSSLTSITIPNSVTSIGSSAFWGCSSLTSITIPNSVTSIGEWAFENVPNVVYNGTATGSPWGARSVNGYVDGYLVYADDTKTTLLACSAAATGEIAIPNSVTSIGDCAFRICSSLTSITIPNSVTSIGNYAFSSCSSLTSITIPNSVTTIGNYAFDRCKALTSVVWNAQDCKGWTDAENAPFRSSRERITSFTFGNQVETIPAYLCDSMVNIKEINIPNSVKTIREGVFNNNVKLAKVTIGTSVETIEANAFAGCRRLYDIYCYPIEPPFAENNSFANYNVYVYVPCENQRDYTLDVVWGEFKFIECIGSEVVVLPDDEVTVAPSYEDVTITWPSTDGAETYSLVITKDDITFCTLVFNAQGQLVSIAFKPRRQNAPAEEGTTPATYAEMTANGFRFKVTGLDEGSAYAYTFTVRNAANSVLETYTGEFTTLSNTPTGVLESAGEDACAPGQAEKLLRDGQVLILRNGETYDMMGQRL